MIGLAHFPDSKTKRRPSEIASVQILRTRHSRLAIFYDYRRKENVAFLEREISERSARPLPNEESSIVYLASNGIVPNDRKSRSRTIYIYILFYTITNSLFPSWNDLAVRLTPLGKSRIEAYLRRISLPS